MGKEHRTETEKAGLGPTSQHHLYPLSRPARSPGVRLTHTPALNVPLSPLSPGPQGLAMDAITSVRGRFLVR